MTKLVLQRHGESEWNKKNLFTGWTDVDLSEKGIEEAHDAGRRLKAEGFVFDIAYTSVLVRATRTLEIALMELGQENIPIVKSWRMNERHYGDLQGFNKAELAAEFGDEKVHIWRRSWDVRPPEMSRNDKRFEGNDPRYSGLKPEEMPTAECLKDTVARVMPFWNEVIVPQLKAGKRILISSHGNSLRAIVKHLDNVPDDEISELNIPTGVPLVYELDSDLKPIKHYYLADEETLEGKIDAVKNQGKAKD